jgi:spore coat protein U-like protein
VRYVALLPLLAGIVGSTASACQVDVVGVTFGEIEAGRSKDSTGRITITCPSAGSYLVGISPGLGGSERRMMGPDGASLRYELYQDAGRNFPWGDDQSIGGALGGVSDGLHPDTYTIYGRVPAQTGKLPGSYMDSLLVTLSF